MLFKDILMLIICAFIDLSDASKELNRAVKLQPVYTIVSNDSAVYYNNDYDWSCYDLATFKYILHLRESRGVANPYMAVNGVYVGKYQFDVNLWVKIPLDSFLRDSAYQERMMDEHIQYNIHMMKSRGINPTFKELFRAHTAGLYTVIHE